MCLFTLYLVSLEESFAENQWLKSENIKQLKEVFVDFSKRRATTES